MGMKDDRIVEQMALFTDKMQEEYEAFTAMDIANGATPVSFETFLLDKLYFAQRDYDVLYNRFRQSKRDNRTNRDRMRSEIADLRNIVKVFISEPIETEIVTSRAVNSCKEISGYERLADVNEYFEEEAKVKSIAESSK